MSMPILASAVARRPHLFVDVRESSRVHSVAGLRAVIDYFLAETIRSKVLRLVHKFKTRARQCQPREGQLRVDPLVWRFRSPHHLRGKSECGLLNQSHTRSIGR
jgi:hypothetical protein